MVEHFATGRPGLARHLPWETVIQPYPGGGPRFGGHHARSTGVNRPGRPCVTAVNGSPMSPSRLEHALAELAMRLEGLGCNVETLHLKEIPPALLLAPPVPDRRSLAWNVLGTTDLVLLGSPIYKSVYSGLLKCWLDHLPRNGFQAKLILPIATCHNANDASAFTDSVRHVCASMGATRLLPTVVLPSSAYDEHCAPLPVGRARLEGAVQGAVQALAEHTGWGAG